MVIKISYSGTYPKLCEGKLQVDIKEKLYRFPDNALESNGSVKSWPGKKIIEARCWSIDKWPEDFPEELKETVLKAVNEQIQHGCCGGCENHS